MKPLLLYRHPHLTMYSPWDSGDRVLAVKSTFCLEENSLPYCARVMYTYFISYEFYSLYYMWPEGLSQTNQLCRGFCFLSEELLGCESALGKPFLCTDKTKWTKATSIPRTTFEPVIPLASWACIFRHRFWSPKYFTARIICKETLPIVAMLLVFCR